MPSATYIRPPMYAKQEAAIFSPARVAVIEASTKSGKTVGCMAWLLEEALKGTRGDNYWWIAPVYSQAKIPYGRFKAGLPPALWVANEGELTLTLPNGAKLWFKGSDKPDTLYGDDVKALVIDEASRCKEDAWTACWSVVTATGGPMRVIGNVKGRKNWAYRLARRAEAGEQGLAYAKITATDAVNAGVLRDEDIEFARRNLPETVFRELYMAEPTEDGSNPFGFRAIREAIRPMSERAPESMGIDLARSVDWTVVVGLDEAGTTCRFDRWQQPWTETMRWIEALVGQTDGLIDATGVGDPITEMLVKKCGRLEGYVFTERSRQDLLEALAVAIQQGDMHFPEGPITLELESFEYEATRRGVKYVAPEGLHDDCVMALGLANLARIRGGVPALKTW